MDALRTLWRVNTFTFNQTDLETLGVRHFVLGLLITWLVGIGRYWDNPRVGLAQHLGVGSVVYIFVLSAWLFLILLPLRPARWSYRHLLIFVSMTSPPAALYAIPVERYMDVILAQQVNVAFLGIVATLRVVMLALYLYRWSEFRGYVLACATLLPLALIVVTLSYLNLDRAVFAIMAGIDREVTADDRAYEWIILVSFLAQLGAPLLIGLYFGAIYARVAARESKKGS